VTAADFWSERDTTPGAIDDALRKLLHQRHVANDRLAPARVLNLVVIVDRDWKGETANRLERVGRYHASRTVLCAVEGGRTSIDAKALLSYEEPGDGGIGLMRERVELDIGTGHLSRIDTIVDPLLAAELPTVLWCPHGHPEAVTALMHTVDVMLVDSDAEPDPVDALEGISQLLQAVYVVDLAWLRTTPWRERLAASFDYPERRRMLRRVAGLAIDHRSESRASALLLSGWLASRLGWTPGRLAEGKGQILSGSAVRPGGELAISLNPAPQEAPGLACVSVACDGEHPIAVSLRRAPGGLDASEAYDDGRHRTWKILGASRGEGGILGEGVRQALLRDVTYGPALDAALEMCPR
jgi:glucose-6-phosphate dehydrogenase assembly protein OpcA